MRTSQRFIKYGVGVAFLFLLLSSSASAQSGKGAVSGWVIDETAALKDGKFVGIASAKVELSGATVMTAKKGNFDFSEIESGQYTLNISAPGYRDYQLSIYINSDDVASVCVLLVKIKK